MELRLLILLCWTLIFLLMITLIELQWRSQYSKVGGSHPWKNPLLQPLPWLEGHRPWQKLAEPGLKPPLVVVSGKPEGPVTLQDPPWLRPCRAHEFSTCKEDRPLLVQFCGNDPDTLLKAAQMVEPYCDYVDINLGCPLLSAKEENYGAYLMDNLPLIKSLVEKLALNLKIPVSCKIRIFPEIEDTIKYAKMLEEAGCSLLAVNGRRRHERNLNKFPADWNSIKAVKAAVRIPVLANGNIRHVEDIYSCLKVTGVDGVLSADPLLENPALLAGFRTAQWAAADVGSFREGNLGQVDLLVEYLNLCEKFPVPWRMVREWFKMYPYLREDLDAQSSINFEFLYGLVDQVRELGPKIPLYLTN